MKKEAVKTFIYKDANYCCPKSKILYEQGIRKVMKRQKRNDAGRCNNENI